MIRGISHSRRSAAIALGGIALALVAAGAGARVRAAGRRECAEAAEAERALAARAAAGAPYAAEHLEALRVHIQDVRGRLGDADAWDQVRETLRHQWRPEGDTAAERGGFSVHAGSFRMASPATSDWPAIVSTVDALERIPGVGIGLLEVAAAGAPGPRPMDLVRVTVVIHSRSPASRPSHENP